MLIPDFYTVVDFQVTENQVNAQVRLNPNHEVYKGHFPGQPVVPGVIQLQIIKELLEENVRKELFLGELAFAKYLQPIIPDQTPLLEFVIKYQEPTAGKFAFTANISNEGIVFTKVKGALFFVIDKAAL